MSYNCGDQYGYAESVFSYKYVTDASVLNERPSTNAPIGLYAINQNPNSNINASSELMGLNNIIGKCGTVTQQESQNNLDMLNEYTNENNIAKDPTDFLSQIDSQTFAPCEYSNNGTLDSDISTIIKHVQRSEMIDNKINQMGAFTRQEMKYNYSNC